MNQKIKLDEILDFRKVVAMINQELRAKGLQPPRGILLVGVPGCGKSPAGHGLH